MSKKTVKIISTIITAAMILMVSATGVFATNVLDNIKPNTTGTGNITNIGNDILGMISVIGTIIAVGVLMVLGIKYMMGSAEEKASYKKTMIPYVVGAILIFAATNIAGIVIDFAEKMSL